jgi:Wzt C-terminal domain
MRLNLEGTAAGGAGYTGSGEDSVRMLDMRLVDADGNRVSGVEHGDEIRIDIELEAQRDFAGLEVAFLLVNDDGVGAAILRSAIGGKQPRPVQAGERIKVETTAPNLLGAGHYVVHCGINRVLEGGVALDVPGAIDFIVFGGPVDRGLVSLPHRSTSTSLGGDGQ